MIFSKARHYRHKPASYLGVGHAYEVEEIRPHFVLSQFEMACRHRYQNVDQIMNDAAAEAHPHGAGRASPHYQSREISISGAMRIDMFFDYPNDFHID